MNRKTVTRRGMLKAGITAPLIPPAMMIGTPESWAAAPRAGNILIRNSITSGIIILAVLPALLWLGRRNLRRNALPAVLFVLSMTLENFLTALPLHIKGLLWFGNRSDWQGIVYSNWEGKTFSIGLALALMLALSPWFSREQFGLTLRQRPGSVRPAFILGIILLLPVTLLAFLAGKGPFDGELLLFLLLMPALSEELVYRGIMLGMADSITPPRWTLGGAPVGWGLAMVTIVFGLLHGFSLEAGGRVNLNPAAVLLSGGYGFAFGWMRERTGSLLLPMVFHGLTDFFQFFWRMV